MRKFLFASLMVLYGLFSVAQPYIIIPKNNYVFVYDSASSKEMFSYPSERILIKMTADSGFVFCDEQYRPLGNRTRVLYANNTISPNDSLNFTFDELFDFSTRFTGSKPEKDPILEKAVRVIWSTWGDYVFIKDKFLIKNGRHDNLSTTEETVWVTGGFESYQPINTNGIDSVVSNDNSNNQLIYIEGHTDSSGYVQFRTQTLTLTGTTPIELPIHLWRASRLENRGSTNFTGNIYVYSGGTVVAGEPQSQDSIYITVTGDDNRTYKTATTLSSEDYWICTGANFSVNRQQTRNVDFKVEVRSYNGVFLEIYECSVSNSSGTNSIVFDPPIIVRNRSDIRVNATSNNTGTVVDAAIFGYLAKKL